MFARLIAVLVLILVAFSVATAQEVEGYFLPLTEEELGELDLENSAEHYNGWLYESEEQAQFYQTTWVIKETSVGQVVVNYFLWKDLQGTLHSSEGYANLDNLGGFLYPVTAYLLPNNQAKFISSYLLGLIVQVTVDLGSGEIVDIFQIQMNEQALNRGLVFEANREGWPSYLNMVMSLNLPTETENFLMSEWTCLQFGSASSFNGCLIAVQAVSYVLDDEGTTLMNFITATESGGWAYSQPISVGGSYFYYNPVVSWDNSDQFTVTSCTLDDVQHIFVILVGGNVTEQTAEGKCDPIRGTQTFPWR